MFKKLLQEIKDKIEESENDVISRMRSRDSISSSYDKLKEKHIETLQSQQRTIEQLINALKDKYEHGLFIFSEDGKIPTVIRNGKELTNDLTTSFSIDWKTGKFPNIQFEQVGGTAHDMEK